MAAKSRPSNWGASMSDGTHASELSHGAGVGTPLKQARLAQGLTLEALAAMTKVAPAKLAALETGRYQDLPDAAFARALAMTVCRVLKIEAAPVLAGLPAAQPISLASKEDRAVPFDASRTKLRLNMDLSPSRVKWPALLSPQWLVPLAVLVAAAGVYLWPQNLQWPAWWPSSSQEAAREASENDESLSPEPADTGLPEPAVAPGESASASEPLPAAETAPVSVVGVPALVASRVLDGPPEAASAPAMPAAVLPAGVRPASSAAAAATPLVMVVSDPSWIEVRDGGGKRLLSRHATPGETIALAGTPPYAVRIGNADGVHVTYLGHEVELAAFTRNNVAKLELK
ncbi:MAG: helix-turn-helix domain-containing protein [Rubrivivax sp.]|nr:MAG: helix-turn-helix domain-containing protein [Rubrivivax sp.]